jgi:hypothetical protein
MVAGPSSSSQTARAGDSTAGPEPALVRLRAWLDAAELDADALRSDPGGAGWLPAELRAEVERDEACRAELAAFVEAELELVTLRSRSGNMLETADPFFVARVAARLPSRPVGPRLSPRERTLLLSLFHGVAALGAWAIVTWLLTDRVQGLADLATDLGTQLGGEWLVGADTVAVGGVAVAASVLALLAFRSHTAGP